MSGRYARSAISFDFAVSAESGLQEVVGARGAEGPRQDAVDTGESTCATPSPAAVHPPQS
jgi:hypothetical protein